MQGNTCVIGAIGEGTSKSVSANWNSPFEEDAVGSKYSKSGGLLQSGAASDVASDVASGLGYSGDMSRFDTTGMTSITTLASHKVWSGNQSHQFSVTLTLYALSDPRTEVEEAIRQLERMAAPSLHEMIPVSTGDDSAAPMLGRTPSGVTINVGRSIIYSDCVIESISAPVDGPRSPEGYLLSADVQLEIATKTLLNRTDI